MARMTIQQELEMLRREVEELKSCQREAVGKKAVETADSEETALDKIRQQLPSLNETAEKIEDDVKDQLQEIIEAFKKDYKAISPLSAMILFALGAAFGRALSSR